MAQPLFHPQNLKKYDRILKFTGAALTVGGRVLAGTWSIFQNTPIGRFWRELKARELTREYLNYIWQITQIIFEYMKSARKLSEPYLLELYNFYFKLPANFRTYGIPTIIVAFISTVGLAIQNQVDSKYSNSITTFNDMLQGLTKDMTGKTSYEKVGLGVIFCLKLMKWLYTSYTVPAFIGISKFIKSDFPKVLHRTPKGDDVKEILDKVEIQSNKQMKNLINTAVKANRANANIYRNARSPTELLRQHRKALEIHTLRADRDKKIKATTAKIEEIDPTNTKRATQTKLAKLIKQREELKSNFAKRISNAQNELVGMARQNRNAAVRVPTPPQNFRKIKNFVATTVINSNLNRRMSALENLVSGLHHKSATPKSATPKSATPRKKTPSPPTPVYSPTRFGLAAEAILKSAKAKKRQSFIRRLRR